MVKRGSRRKIAAEAYGPPAVRRGRALFRATLP